MPRPALRDDQIEAFRRRLCDVATRRFAEQGIAGVSLRGLADELGCSRGTPYRYFRDKNEILAVVRAQAFSALAAACNEAGANEPDTERRLAAIGRAYLRFSREEPHAYRVAFELDQLDADAYAELVEERTRAWSSIRDAVQAAFDAGLLEGDPETVARLYWAGLHGVAALALADQLPAADLVALEEPMIQTLLRGTRVATRTESSSEEPMPDESTPDHPRADHRDRQDDRQEGRT